MIYVWLAILILLNGCWLATVLFTVPGNWLMVITTCLFAWWQWDNGIFGLPLLVLITVLALIGELVEFFAGAGGAKKAGASWRGAAAAIGGAIFGAIAGTVIIPVPLFGTMLGACFGAGLLTWLVERKAGKTKDQSVEPHAARQADQPCNQQLHPRMLKANAQHQCFAALGACVALQGAEVVAARGALFIAVGEELLEERCVRRLFPHRPAVYHCQST